jgi:hypothetical protein
MGDPRPDLVVAIDLGMTCTLDGFKLLKETTMLMI